MYEKMTEICPKCDNPRIACICEKNTKKENFESLKGLPPLQEGFCRLVHITNPNIIESIKTQGLDYSKQGMVTATARIWINENECEYTSDDPRFKNGVAVVMDVPLNEIRIHNDITKSPGIIPAKYFVGIVEKKNNQ